MIYTKKDFGRDLKERVMQKIDKAEIGSWIYTIYSDWPDVNDTVFLSLLLELNGMEDGEEFERSYEELEQIADDLIAGKDVKL